AFMGVLSLCQLLQRAFHRTSDFRVSADKGGAARASSHVTSAAPGDDRKASVQGPTSLEPQRTADGYTRLLAELDRIGADYRLLEHLPEGRTDVASELRGHPLAHAAKCLIIMVKVSKRETRYVLAVVPGDARLDVKAVKALAGGSYAAFAPPEVAERLSGTV